MSVVLSRLLKDGTTACTGDDGMHHHHHQQHWMSESCDSDLVVLAEHDIVKDELNLISEGSLRSSELSALYDRFPTYHVVSDFDLEDDDDDNDNESDDDEDEGYNDEAAALLLSSEGQAVFPVAKIQEEVLNDTHSHVLEGYARPQFLYSQVIKSTPDCQVGISFKNRRVRTKSGGRSCSVVINHIQEDGMFGKTNNNCLQPGDEVIAVNGHATNGMKASHVAKLLRQATNMISLAVRNSNGDPRLVFNSIQKPTASSMVGVALKNNHTGNTLVISRVDMTGLFSSSLVMPGQRVLMINGVSCKNMHSQDAVELIHRSATESPTSDETQHHVTMITKPRDKTHDYAMVISCDSKKKKGLRHKVMKRLGWNAVVAASRSASKREAHAVATIVDVDETASSTYNETPRRGIRSRSQRVYE